MKGGVIAANSLRRLFRDRTSIFFVFIFPMLLILLLGLSFGGASTPRLGVTVEDASPLGQELAEDAERLTGVDVVRYPDGATLARAVERGNVSAGMVIPATYGARLAAGQEASVRLLARPDGSGEELRLPVNQVLSKQASLVRAARFAEIEAGATFDEGLRQARTVREAAPGIHVAHTVVGEAREGSGLNAFGRGAASQLVLFMFLTSLSGSSNLILSRQLGVSRRMLATPTAARTVLLGEMLGRFGVTLVQGVVIVAGSALLFGVQWGDPVGSAALVVTFGLVGAGAATLVGSVLQSSQQAESIGVLGGLGLGALGGAMVPLEVFPDAMRQVAQFTPHAWALEGFSRLLRDDAGVLDILPQLGVLGVFAAALLVVSSWTFHRSLTGSVRLPMRRAPSVG